MENEIIESCQCNNCLRYFESDAELEHFEEEDGEIFLGCPECRTDAYLMEYIKEENKMEKVYKEMANGYILEMLEQKMENMVGCRGTISSLTNSIQEFALRDNIILEPFEENFQDMDCGFNTNLGEIEGTYFDFEVFMLPTNEEGVFIITEINSF